jgi:cell division transport system ATP-binding protein
LGAESGGFGIAAVEAGLWRFLIGTMIVFINVTKTFPTGQTALSDISFEIGEGEFVFFVGESGAGKTTIMRLMTHDMSATSGKIMVLGQDLSKLRGSQLPQLRRNVSVIFQDYKLFGDRTVAENIALALEIVGMKKQEIQSRVKDLLQLVGLEEKELYFPRQLSGGEAQRVSIARALAIGPKVIFADEPTGNLDHESSMQIARLFEKINSLGTTILMATHNLDIVKALKKREIHLHKGKLITDTKPHGEVKSAKPVASTAPAQAPVPAQAPAQPSAPAKGKHAEQPSAKEKEGEKKTHQKTEMKSAPVSSPASQPPVQVVPASLQKAGEKSKHE